MSKQRKCLTLCLFILMTISINQVLYAQDQEPPKSGIDSAMALSPDYMPIYYAAFPTIHFNPMQYQLLDTSMFHTSDYAPFYESQNIYQGIGINGQAHKSMVFDYQKEVGFNMITLPYPLYFKEQKDLRFYNVETSFTRLAYTYGLSTEHNFSFTHAQKIKDVEFSLDLTALSNKGYFIHQSTNMLSLDGVFHYQTPKDIYGITVSYIFNHAKFSENGGLTDYRSFAERNARDENFTNDLGSFNVFFSNASTLINTHDVMLQQYVNLKDAKGRYYGTFTHSFQFKHQSDAFNDYDLNNSYYRDRYFFSTDTTRDTLSFWGIVNTLQWSNYEPLAVQSQSNYSFRFAGGVRHEFVSAKLPYYIGNSVSLFARTSIRLFKVWDIHGNIAYSFFRYNNNDAIANADATFAINRKQRHFIGLEADFYRVSPDFIFTRYVGNNNTWEKDWKKENNLKLGVFYTIFGYKVSFNYFMMNHHKYLNSNFEPESFEKSINVVQLNLFAPVRIKNFYMDVNLSLQHSTQPYIAVPLFAGKLYAAYQFRIFRNRLHIQIGGDLMYNTLYFADGYNPIIHQFYYQQDVKVGNYLYFDLNITFRVNRIAFYVRGGNLLEGVFSYKYFTTPYYPMQGRNLELGITWRFYD